MLVAQQNVVTTGKACRLSTVVNGDAGVGSNPTTFIQISLMVIVAQLVEPWFVEPVVGSSSLLSHPKLIPP